MKSYPGKELVIVDNHARVRRSDDLARFDGDTVIPKRTRIIVTDVRANADKTTFVYARPIDGSSGAPEGWTKATNLEGAFLNERCRAIPIEWTLAPQGSNKTICDANALIRRGPPSFQPSGGSIEHVSREHWHWEYLPDDARQLSKTNKFKLSHVDPLAPRRCPVTSHRRTHVGTALSAWHGS